MEGCAMGQVLHGSARTTEAVRRAIQHSEESLRSLAKRFGINQKTVAKWKSRASVTDRRTGPRDPKSTVLSLEEEAIIVAFCRHTLLPLDDCLYALQATIPRLTRSSLHRCLQRHGISRLAEVQGDKPARRRFKTYPIGFFHIDIQFADLPKNRSGPTARWRGHPFDRACQHHRIEHRLTRQNHPWTNGQVERMNRTIKEATVKRYHYDSHEQLRRHLDAFVSAYNFGRRLKTLKGLTLYEFICKTWTSQPKRFTLNPLHQMPGPNILEDRTRSE